MIKVLRDKLIFNLQLYKEVFIRTFFKLIGYQPMNCSDILIFADLKRFEKYCILIDILPRGLAQKEIILKNRKTRRIILRYFIYLFLFRNLLLTFELADWAMVALGDIYIYHPKRRTIWSVFLLASFILEAIQEVYKHLEASNKLKSLTIYQKIMDQGFNPKLVQIEGISLRTYRWILHNIIVQSVRIINLMLTAPMLIFLYASIVNRSMPNNLLPMINFIFWLLVTHFGFAFICWAGVCTAGLGSMVILELLFRLKTLKRKVNALSRKKVISSDDLETTVNPVIICLNDIEATNITYRQWVLLATLGLSSISDLGIYVCIFKHVDNGLIDLYFICLSLVGLGIISAYSLVNGSVLRKLMSICKSFYVIATRTKSDQRLNLKTIKLRDRLIRTDAAITMGEGIALSSQFFVIYLLENAGLLLMLIVNLR